MQIQPFGAVTIRTWDTTSRTAPESVISSRSSFDLGLLVDSYKGVRWHKAKRPQEHLAPEPDAVNVSITIGGVFEDDRGLRG